MASIEALRDAQRNGPVLIDDEGRILAEYRPYFSYRGQPGPGDRFFRWLVLNLANPARCRQIHIPLVADEEEFEDFPRDPDLAGFDPSDRKYVAVALASGLNPVIVNSTDTDWWHHQQALAKHGVRLEFLCPHLMELRNRP